MQVAEGSVAEMHQHQDTTDDEYQDEAVYPDSVVDPSFNTMDRLADLADEEENPTDYPAEDGDDNADVEMQPQDYMEEVEERAEPQYIQLAPPTPLTVRRAIVSVFSIVIYIIYYKSVSNFSSFQVMFSSNLHALQCSSSNLHSKLCYTY